jgi:CheY-like chemotaxis protein
MPPAHEPRSHELAPARGGWRAHEAHDSRRAHEAHEPIAAHEALAGATNAPSRQNSWPTTAARRLQSAAHVPPNHHPSVGSAGSPCRNPTPPRGEEEEAKMAKKILLVDDAGAVLLMERMILSHGCYQLSEARSGEEAVDKARRERPDLVVVNLVVPDGAALLAELRRDEATRHIPLIVVTSAEPPTSLAGHGHEVMTRPLSSVQLLARVRHLLGERP